MLSYSYPYPFRGASVKKVVVNAREVVADIKSGKTDAELLEKYGLSPKSLLSLKRQVLARKLVRAEDLAPKSRGPNSPCPGKRLDVNQFLNDFRHRPDDRFLMIKYSLGPKQLERVYRTLIDKRLLSEYECECRDVKAQELHPEISACEAASDMVEMLERETPPAPRKVPSEKDRGLPEGFFTDFSGVKIQRTAPDLIAGPVDGDETPVRSSPQVPPNPPTTVVEVVTCELCPRCSAPKSPDSVDACLHCGIVFAKVESKTGAATVCVWKGNLRGR